MSSLSEQDPLNPNDPEFYAPPRLRERAAKLGLSLSQEARLDPIRSSPISLPASLENQDNDALWNPLAPEVINQPARLAWDRRTVQLSIATAAAGVVMVVVLLFFIVKPAPRQLDAGSTSSEIKGSMSTAQSQSGQGDVGTKPALAEFQALAGPKPAIAEFQAFLATVPPSQRATHEQSQQLLQQFLQWRKNTNTAETSQ
jgi:hypothetical protein